MYGPKAAKLPELNVYILGIDSTSRMHAIRKLPKLYEFFTKDLGGIVLEGYNIVGDGTPQALIPILTGKTEQELPLTRKRYANASFVDVYPWIWNAYRNAGYITLFAEDYWGIGTFQFRLKGFKKQPTDHYGRPFFKNAKGPCVGNEPVHKVLNRYSEQFFDNYPKNLKKFAFLFHVGISHDDMNQVELADDDFVSHLWFLKTVGHLDHTLLILMSDHGTRFSKMRITQQGQLEERLPLFGFAAPGWFRKRYPEAWRNMKINSKRLTSPFDIFETLKMLLNWRKPETGDVGSRGISLFDEVPKERTCKQAGIDPHWCVCLSWQRLSSDDAFGNKVVHAVIDRINDETKEYRKLCATLELSKINSIKRLVPNDKLMKYKTLKDLDGFDHDFYGNIQVNSAMYQVTFWTKPGGGHYEATAQRKGQSVIVDLKSVSRIDKYGDKPHCVVNKDAYMGKWCICYDRI